MPIKNYEEWQAAVKKAYPDEAPQIKFKGRIEQGEDTISAEIPGKDRSYGVWDSDKDEGSVLTAALLIEARLDSSVEARILPSDAYVWFTFTGRGFDGMNEARRTVSLQKGDKFGVRKSSDGKNIRLITEKDGPNKVYTCDLPTAQYLGKRCQPVQASVETAAKPKLSQTFKQLQKVMQELGYAPSQTWTLMNPGYPVTAWECGESTDTVTKLLTSKISGLVRDSKQFKGHINFTGDDKTLVQVFVDKRKTIISCPVL